MSDAQMLLWTLREQLEFNSKSHGLKLGGMAYDTYLQDPFTRDGQFVPRFGQHVNIYFAPSTPYWTEGMLTWLLEGGENRAVQTRRKTIPDLIPSQSRVELKRTETGQNGMEVGYSLYNESLIELRDEWFNWDTHKHTLARLPDNMQKRGIWVRVYPTLRLAKMASVGHIDHGFIAKEHLEAMKPV